MQIISKSCPQENAVGYYLNVTASEAQDTLQSVFVEDSPFHARLTISIPKANPVTMLLQLIGEIRSFQKGKRLPVRMRWDNLKSIFTMDEIRLLDTLDAKTFYCLYGAPQPKHKYDTHELSLRVKRQQYQEKKAGKEP